MKKPNVIYVEAEAIRRIKNPDCLSLDASVFRNGGRVNGEEAVAFVELTEEIIEIIRANL